MDSISVDEVDAKPKRPGIRRETSTPAPPPPPSQPPPAPPPSSDPTDSLSLPQLRQLVSQFPKSEATPYSFQYKDAEDFESEIDEWFHYTELDQDRQYLLASLEAFEAKWTLFCQAEGISDDSKWSAVSDDQRQRFASSLINDLADRDYAPRVDALSCIYYILMGTWGTTSGLETKGPSTEDDNEADNERSNLIQIEWMHKGADIVQQALLIPPIHNCLIQASHAPDSVRSPQSVDVEDASEGAFGEDEYRELSLCLSCFYLLIESARVRTDTAAGQAIRQSISSLQPSFLVFLVGMISRLRWDETYNIPLMHALQLFWKSILLLFGNVSNHLEKIKSILQPREDPFSADAAHPKLTASPLDYHAFRQEITSKYPAYNPPPNIIPLELEQKTMLPPLTTNSRNDVSSVASSSLPGARSILHQPVHIATPAPSPPPSPIGPGGKAGKKQNYQTNQNFPFLYPPLDSTSDNIGGKGSTQIQDMMVGKKWEGSDVPLSIIEAGELFASRMRMTRAMRQLWKERDLFLKYERGWKGDIKDAAKGEKDGKSEEEQGLDGLEDSDLRSRMLAVDDFFHYALPDLQSLVIVMMKVMLTNVQDIAVRNGGAQEPAQSGGLNRTKSNSNMAQNQTLPIPPPPARPNEMTLEDLDNVRSREISQKAISGAIFLLLKWFKISHVLKFEYLTQLLLDSNYVQLTLKYFAHQNLEDLVSFKYDRDDLSVWHYCHVHSGHPPLSPTSPDERSEASDGDEAVPPPIARHRRSPTANSGGQPPNEQTQDAQQQQPPDQGRPSVDELGNPLGPIPQTPITTFSFRQFQTSIHLLRVLQKLTRGKSHRILFLVQFKSSQILRRVLRVPDPTLRLYVLKLFKSQVPYCGRKWRQSNMRVITAIYLHCRPELRDEWLAGMHDANVEGEVDEAVPLEWALRGLTFWWQKRRYPDVTRKGKKGTETKAAEEEDDLHDIDDDERDFFQRELDALGWGLAALRVADGEDVVFGEEAGVNGAHGVINGVTNNVVDTGVPQPGTGAGETRTPQTPVPQPQWVVADAAALDNWQNS
ncbi:putative pheromone-dependent cell cycle arrest protein Far11 [Cladophialophora carrionii]|uniref:Putative pheromone-dependent cell cycle arrest protein Far11 n=1 Tax=Cladophialophora carrionii TaxID=86049 RepID=A0A1C1CAW7_9EURO|nr:putative pheromone-dependent cell cycle arrest protein Far11 [Cladophialophora carrionii]